MMSRFFEDRNRTSVRILFEDYINAARRELLPELVDDEFLGAQGETGTAGFEGTIDSLRSGMPDIRFTLEDLIAEADKVVARWTWSGRHAGAFRGFAPSNRQVSNSGIGIYQLRDARLVRAWMQTDRLGFLQQIGALPANLTPLGR
ncbi:MAG: ester cyclase [Acidobacteria bacterium]|nr:ester cyclase [Acidobacteriota bacterium]